jgi:exonuclease III
MNRHTTLSILQYNVHKSRDMVMASMLRDPRVHEYDILAIQEPWRNPFAATTHHPAKNVFHLCCPAEEEAGPARVCFFINKRLDHKKWQFKEHSRDVCSLTVEFGDDQRERQHITIHNIYNPARRSESDNTVLTDARTVLHKNQSHEQILLGDFNLHHPMWGGANVRHTDPESADLLAIMEDFNLDSTLPPGTITYEERTARTTIDLCLVTVGLIDRVIRSQVDRDLDHDSDHLPISTVIDMRVQQLETSLKQDWKRLDERIYHKALRKALLPLQRPANKTALDMYVQEVVKAIQKAIDQALPHTRPSDRMREGWSDECKAVLAEAKRLKRAHSQHHTDESWEAYRAARNHKARTIKKALRDAHREQVEQAAKSPEAL